jgi:streptogramin lyase
VLVLVLTMIGATVGGVPLDTHAVAAPSFTTFPTPTPGSGPSELRVGPDGNLWFPEHGGNNIGRASTAGVITEYPLPTPGAGPSGMVAGPDGNMWFVEHSAGKVGKITPAGEITEYSIPTPGAGPHHITLGADGNLWFTETEVNKIGRITTDGVIDEFDVPTDDTGPVGIAAGSDGNVWFTESRAGSVGRITPTGAITEFPVPGAHGQWSLATGADGNVWYTHGQVHAIGRVTMDGAVTEFPTDDPDSMPNFVGAGPDGNVWYTDMRPGAYKVGSVTPAGEVTEYPLTGSGLPTGITAGPDGEIWFTTVDGSALVRMRLTPDPTGEFTAVTPARILDTRDGTGGLPGPIGHQQEVDVQVAGMGGVPDTGVRAVVLNATVTQPTAAGHLTIWPAGVARPLISNLNFVPGQTVPNLVTVALGSGGQLSAFNAAGSSHVIFDVVGYYSDVDGPIGSRHHAVAPSRLFDTRVGSGGVPAAPLTSGQTLGVAVTGKGGVPSTGVTAVIMNVTVTAPTASGHVTVYPDDVSRPTASNLNFVAGLTVPNLVEVRVPDNGVVDFHVFANGGSAHLLTDVVGYYDGDKSTEAGRFITGTPIRIIDSREASPAPPPGCFPGDSALVLTNPNTIVGGMVLNTTVTAPTDPGHLTVFPEGPRPLASNLNFVAGQTVPNLVVVGSPNRRYYFVPSAGCVHLVVDAFGIFTNASAPPPGELQGAATPGTDLDVELVLP